MRHRLAVFALLATLGSGLLAPIAAGSESEADEEGSSAAPASRPEAPAVAERTLLLRAKVASALAQLAPIKTMMTESFLVSGEWPRRPSDLGLDEASLTSSVVAGVTFEAGGVILARLAPELGSAATLRLSPRSVMAGTSLEWRCEATLPQAVLRTLPCAPAPSEP